MTDSLVYVKVIQGRARPFDLVVVPVGRVVCFKLTYSLCLVLVYSLLFPLLRHINWYINFFGPLYVEPEVRPRLSSRVRLLVYIVGCRNGGLFNTLP